MCYVREETITRARADVETQYLHICEQRIPAAASAETFQREMSGRHLERVRRATSTLRSSKWTMAHRRAHSIIRSKVRKGSEAIPVTGRGGPQVFPVRYEHHLHITK
jgi:hypothetical protein